MGFLKKLPRAFQPHQPGGLNHNHWLVSKGISFLGNYAWGYLNGGNVAPSTTAGEEVDSAGVVSKYSGSNFQTFERSVSGFPCTLGFWYKTGATTVDSSCISIGTSGSNDQRIVLSFVVSTVRAELFTRTTAGTVVYSGSPGLFETDTWYFLVGVVASPTDARVYINGGNEGSSTSVNACTGATKTYVGATVGASMIPAIAGAKLHMPFVLPWAMTAEEVARLYQEQKDSPWQIYANRQVFIPVKSGIAGTIIDFTTATLTKTTQTIQNSLQAVLSNASLQYLANAIQNSLLISTTTATLSKVAQTIQNKVSLVLSTPTFTFTPLSISLGTILTLGVGLLTFTSWSIDVTGAIATVLRLLALIGVGS